MLEVILFLALLSGQIEPCSSFLILCVFYAILCTFALSLGFVSTRNYRLLSWLRHEFFLLKMRLKYS